MNNSKTFSEIPRYKEHEHSQKIEQLTCHVNIVASSLNN